MTILDTFTILFKSNAADVKKDMGEAEQATKNFQSKIDATDKTLGQLGTKLLQVGLEGVTAFASFEGLKSGITNAIQFNAELEKTSILTGQSSRELGIYDATFAQFGANSGEFISWFTQYSQYLQKLGLDSKNILPSLKALANELKSLPEQQARQRFQNVAEATGLPQNFYLVLRQGADAIESVYNAQSKLVGATEANTKAALEMQSAIKNLGTETQNFFTEASTAAGWFIRRIEETIKGFRILLGLVETVGSIGNHFQIAPSLQKMLYEDFGIGSAPSAAPQSSGSKAENEKQSYDFWRSQGFTSAQASGLVANEKRESNFDPNATGDNGQAKGIFQWHGDRRAAILAATGIDVSNASHADQLKAAAWELQNRGDSDKLRGMTSSFDSGALISRIFERPAYGFAESQIRGMMATQEMRKFGDSATSSPSFNVNSIVVQTQATDADGIAASISDKLNYHFRAAASNFDDMEAK